MRQALVVEDLIATMRVLARRDAKQFRAAMARIRALKTSAKQVVEKKSTF